MPVYRMLIEYDGTDFQGWQIQPSGPSVQETIENALGTVLHTRPTVTGSGRTDTGVHARGQVAHFSVDSELDPYRLRRSLNGLLPASVAVLALERAPDDFHARYDARRRLYHYYVCTEPRALDRSTRVLLLPAPDFEVMNRAAELLPGAHNFDAFCRTSAATRNRHCTVYRAVWVKEARRGDWHFEIEADRFLHGMVRAVVGTLLQIGRGKRPPSDIERILRSEDRRQAGPAAPAHGLVLEHVTYEEKIFESL